MNVPFNDLSRLNNSLRKEIMRAFEDVLGSPSVVLGPQLEDLEGWLTTSTKKAGTVGVGNGTDALEIAFRVLASEKRNIIITQGNAGGYSSIAAMRAGLEVMFCDLDATGKSFDSSDLRELLSLHGESVAAIVVTHLYGIVSNLSDIIGLARSFEVPVVEDCAQAIGVTTNGGTAGSFGDVACFSFYPTKNLGALGDGGAVSFANYDDVEKARKLREYGWSEKYKITVDGGRNTRLDEIQAAVLNVKREFLEEWNSERLDTHELYSRELRDLPFLSFVAEEGDFHNAHLEVVKLESTVRAKFLQHMKLEGVDCRIHYPICDHQQLTYRDAPVSLLRSEKMAAQVVTLPNFPLMTQAEKDKVVSTALRFGESKDI